MSRYAHVPSLGASETIALGIGRIGVLTSDIADIDRPVVLSFGPLSLCMAPAEAIAFGDALIRMAHHYTATLAEYHAAQGAQAGEA